MLIICAGDCGVDHYTTLSKTYAGGISLNVARHAKTLLDNRSDVAVLGVIGNDSYADQVRDTLRNANIQNFLISKTGQTPIQYIQNTEAGEKIFTKYDEGVLRNFTVNQQQTEILRTANVIVSPLFSQIEPFFASVIRTNSVAKKIADFGSLEDYDFSMNIVKKYIHHVDICFFGLQTENHDLLKKIQQLSKRQKKLFVITLGAAGSKALFEDKEFQAASEKVEKVLDTTGAGDGFLAAFLSEYLFSNDIAASLRKGNKYASSIVQKIGSV